MPLDFRASSVVVTGGAAGIGRAVAELFVAEGASVATLDIDPNGPSGATHFHVDLREEDAVAQAFETFGSEHGGIDVLVNNAGVSFVGGVEEGSLDEWRRLYEINVLGAVRCTRAALPFLRRSVHAAIVNMSSCVATSGFRQRALYAATKGALHSMTFSMAADLLAEGIRVNCVAPGTVDTPFMEKLALLSPDPAARRAEFGHRQPTGHMVAPIEVARAVAYLAHPLSVSTVGTVLVVDGGLGALRGA